MSRIWMWVGLVFSLTLFKVSITNKILTAVLIWPKVWNKITQKRTKVVLLYLPNFSLTFEHPLYARRFDLNKATNQIPPFLAASYITTFSSNWRMIRTRVFNHVLTRWDYINTLAVLSRFESKNIYGNR